MIIKHLKTVQNVEEKNLMEIQRNIFLNWRQNRADLIKAQVVSDKILKLGINFTAKIIFCGF